MLKRICAVVLLVVGILAVGYVAWGRSGGRVYAEGQQVIPRAWGTLKAAAGQELYFEAVDGTIRVYDMVTRRLVAEYVRL